MLPRESDHRRGYRGLAGTNHSNDKPPRLLSPPGRSATYESHGDASIAPMTGAGRLLRHGPTRRGSAVRTIAMRDKRS
jgi:hypothetical protein